jgi:hypothetical protein
MKTAPIVMMVQIRASDLVLPAAVTSQSTAIEHLVHRGFDAGRQIF